MRRSRPVPFPLIVERAKCLRDRGRIDPGAGGKRDQEILVLEHMLEHAGEKAWLARRPPDLLDRYSGCANKAVYPFGFFGDEGKCLNRQRFCGFPRWSQGGLHWVTFAFP